MDKNLIITLPGWSPVGNGWSMATLNYRFRKDADLIAVNYKELHDHDLEIYAHNLVAKIQEWELKKIYKNIALVGYSMGGVLAALVVSKYPEHFDAMAAIAAPMRGTEAARWISWSTTGKEMLRQSKAIRQIAGESPIPALALFPEYEFWMTEFSATKFCQEKQIIPNSSHSTIVHMRRTYEEIASWLNYTIFDKDPTVEDEQSYVHSKLALPSSGN